jgi:ABC-type Fe3+/spermidine/putrescine transport system ATPase subunit
MIAGFVSPSAGDILVDGRSVRDVPPYRRPVNMVFQHYALFPHMSVAENIGFGLEMHKVPRVERERRIAEVLELVELPGFEARSVRELSGGQEQRVALARALVLKPATLLLDEPLGALDQKVRRKMQLELKRIHRDIGITFIHVTHDQEEALAMADRLAVMNDSRLEQIGNTFEVYAKPQTPFAAEFVGETNGFQGVVADCPDVGPAVELAPGLWAAIPAIDGVAPGATVQVFVRPEQLRIAPPEHSGMNCFEGTVRDIVFLGDATRCIIAIADSVELMVSVAGGEAGPARRLARRDKITIGWPRDAAMVFAER